MLKPNDILKMTRTGRDGRTLRCRIEAGYFVLSGGEWGEHRLAIAHTDDKRLAAHWDGYCSENGWIKPRPERGMYEGRTASGEALCFIAVGSPQSWRNRR